VNPLSWPEKLLGLAVVLLLAAWLTNKAMHLLLAVWPALAIVAGTVTFGGLLFAWWRGHSQRW